MDAKINHFTILSEDNYALGRFYEGFFHMRPAGEYDATGAVRIGDGHVGLNIKPRLPGLRAQLNQFGIQVDDIELAMARIREGFPEVEWLEDSGPGKAALFTTHDPAGNFFSLSQAGANVCKDFYRPDGMESDRMLDHFALRVLNAERVAEFYAKVFDMSPLERPTEQKNFYLSDGRITLVIIPWSILVFEGTGITARGMDHIGFRVESLYALKADIDRITTKNYRFQPRTSIVGRGKEGGGRLIMFRKSCPLGHHQMADSDGFLLDARE
jgi:predicted enzyme related to lactoylglutathione lyase